MKKFHQQFAHFFIQDTQDFLVGWLLLLIILLASVFLPAIQSGDSLAAYAYCFLMFFLFYTKQVWGEGQMALNTISRSYLRTLPISRLRLFALNFCRTFVGGLPLFILGTYQIYKVRMTVLESNPLFITEFLTKVISLIAGSSFMIASLFLFTVVFIAPATEQESLMRTAGRTQRGLKITFTLARSLTDAFFFGLWVTFISKVMQISFPVPTLLPILGPGIALIYFSFRLYSSYQKWLYE